LATLFGTSAFAESRHQSGTRGSSHGSSRGSSHSFSRPSFSRPSFSRPSFSRPSFSRPSFSRPSSGSRFDSRSFAGRNSGSRGSVAPRGGTAWRGSRPPSYGRSVPYRGGNYYNNGSRFYGRGRIDRVVPYNGGYRIWLGGWGYPFFVPYRFWDPFRFRLGLFVGFNAFYDPLGYYNVYGWPGYYPPPAYVGAYRNGYYNRGNDSDGVVVRGVVESIDLHSGLVVVSDDVSRRSVTA